MASRPQVYLDNHATTRLDPRVLDAMLPFLRDNYGNAASRSHEFGWTAEAGVNLARKQIADLIGAAAEEIVFTSGATESINLALKGIAEAAYRQGTHATHHIITAATEHRAVLDSCRRLEGAGFRLTVLRPDASGIVSPESIRDALTEDTVLVSIMWANNEIGTIAPMTRIAELCTHRGVLFHTDATQAVGRIPVDLRTVPVDMLSCSAHKMYGPKGVGALYVRTREPRIPLTPQIDGGGHEHGLRSGTLNVPGIVGFGKAADLALRWMSSDASRIGQLRDRLVDGITQRLETVVVNGHPTDRLPENASLTFPGFRADALMMAMKDLAVSSGSACSSALPGPSHVLRAIGLTDADAGATLRFGLGRFTTSEEIEYAIGRVVDTVRNQASHQNPAPEGDESRVLRGRDRTRPADSLHHPSHTTAPAEKTKAL